jgi:ribosome biogenesis GTPase
MAADRKPRGGEAPAPIDEALAGLGLSDEVRAAFRAACAEPSLSGAALGRILSEHRGGCFVSLGRSERLALPTGQLRRAAEEAGASRPAVGDWVALTESPGKARGPALIAAILPRKNRLARKAAGLKVREQVLAANVDQAFIVDAPRPQSPADPADPAGPADPADAADVAAPPATARLNLGRLTRYVALVREGGVRPILLVTKADLLTGAEADALRRELAAALPELEVHLLSSVSGQGLDGLLRYVEAPLTSVLLGPSGVGKSSLLNALSGTRRQDVQAIGAAGKGRHTTTHRELFRLPQGGLIIDTPGMRELGLWEGGDGEGVREAFPELDELAAGCRFRDCAHEREPGCAVRAAVEAGTLPSERYAAWHKLRRESQLVEAQADAALKAQKKKTAAQRTRALDELYRRRGH